MGTDTTAPQIELMTRFIETRSSTQETNETLLNIIDEQNKAIKQLFESNQKLIAEVAQLRNEISVTQEIQKEKLSSAVDLLTDYIDLKPKTLAMKVNYTPPFTMSKAPDNLIEVSKVIVQHGQQLASMNEMTKAQFHKKYYQEEQLSRKEACKLLFYMPIFLERQLDLPASLINEQAWHIKNISEEIYPGTNQDVARVEEIHLRSEDKVLFPKLENHFLAYQQTLNSHAEQIDRLQESINKLKITSLIQ